MKSKLSDSDVARIRKWGSNTADFVVVGVMWAIAVVNVRFGVCLLPDHPWVGSLFICIGTTLYYRSCFGSR